MEKDENISVSGKTSQKSIDHFPFFQCNSSPASLGIGIWVSVTLFGRALPTVMFMAARSLNLAIAANWVVITPQQNQVNINFHENEIPFKLSSENKLSVPGWRYEKAQAL